MSLDEFFQIQQGSFLFEKKIDQLFTFHKEIYKKCEVKTQKVMTVINNFLQEVRKLTKNFFIIFENNFLHA